MSKVSVVIAEVEADAKKLAAWVEEEVAKLRARLHPVHQMVAAGDATPEDVIAVNNLHKILPGIDPIPPVAQPQVGVPAPPDAQQAPAPPSPPPAI